MHRYTASERHSYRPFEGLHSQRCSHSRIFKLSNKLVDMTAGVQVLFWVSACEVRKEIFSIDLYYDIQKGMQ